MISKKFNNSNNKRPNYLRYDDVFISRENRSRERFPRSNNRYNEEEEIDKQVYQQYETEEDEKYFTEKKYGNILDEKMVRYQKRELPPLQRYGSANNPRAMYDEYNSDSSSYWRDGYDPPNRNSGKQYRDEYFFKSVWQKFIVIFSSVISLICLGFVVYNWESRTTRKSNIDGNTVVIEPEFPSFKILPDNPGGINVPHQDKKIYGNIRNSKDRYKNEFEDESSLLPPQEIPSTINRNSDSDMGIDEYSIIDDKIYYIKIATNKNKNSLNNQMSEIKNKYKNKLPDATCSIQSVRDKKGEKKYAVLIGPFDSRDNAIDSAKKLETDCSVVAVRE
ncbi:MAG: SPOR domain-containing protein [Holosporales bacterium]|jgi:hypothetical protein|nr:SPOR domain-containing protein [Holosporales bacterium]